jgi:hypothetical protein
VVTGFTDFIPNYENDAGILRTVRLMRPLRTITTVKGMRLLVGTLLQTDTLKNLANVIFLSSFMYIVFAIIGTELFAGVLRGVCFDFDTLEPTENMPVGATGICSPDSGGRSCLDGQICSRTDLITGLPNSSPAYDIVSFDDFFHSLLTIFTMLTLEGWTDVMYAVQDGYSVHVWIYFVLLVTIGVFIVMTLFLAVIAAGYESQVEEEDEERKLDEEAGEYLRMLTQGLRGILTETELEGAGAGVQEAEPVTPREISLGVGSPIHSWKQVGIKERDKLEARSIWDDVDAPGNGHLNQTGLQNVVEQLLAVEENTDLAKLGKHELATLPAIDKGASGEVTFGEFWTWWEARNERIALERVADGIHASKQLAIRRKHFRNLFTAVAQRNLLDRGLEGSQDGCICDEAFREGLKLIQEGANAKLDQAYSRTNSNLAAQLLEAVQKNKFGKAPEVNQSPALVDILPPQQRLLK